MPMLRVQILDDPLPNTDRSLTSEDVYYSEDVSFCQHQLHLMGHKPAGSHNMEYTVP